MHLALFHTFIKLCRHHCDTNQKTCAHLQIIRSNHPLNPTCSLPNHIPWCHIHTSLKHPLGQGLRHLPWQPIPIPDHPFREEIRPDIQPKPPLAPPRIQRNCPTAGARNQTHHVQVIARGTQAHVGPSQEAGCWHLVLSTCCIRQKHREPGQPPTMLSGPPRGSAGWVMLENWHPSFHQHCQLFQTERLCK